MEGENFVIVEAREQVPLLLCCDHASKEFPAELDTLGLKSAHFSGCSYLYDLGAEALFDTLCTELGCAGIKTRISRLAVDVNRLREHEELIRTTCCGEVIPGNHGLDAEARTGRVQRWYTPYHEARAALFTQLKQMFGSVPLFSLHTMAAQHYGETRTMDFSLIAQDGCALCPLVRTELENRGYSVTFIEPFQEQKELIQAIYKELFAHFTDGALVIEMNDKHAAAERVWMDLAAALKGAVEKNKS